MAAFKLTLDAGALRQVADDAAYRVVTDTMRRVLNRATVLTPVDTGRLRAGNMSRVSRTAQGVLGEIINLTEYADAVHDGSRAYTVRPRRAKVLRFVVGGKVVYAKSARIPARKGRPWLLRALKEIAIPEGYRMVG